MIIRAAKEADLSGIRDLYDALVDETSDRPFLRIAWERRVDRVRDSIAAGLTLVADDSGSLIAFIEGSKVTGQLGWIRNVYVKPAARRRGVARTMIAAVASRFESVGITSVGVKVGSANHAANQAYERLGFEEFARVLSADTNALLPRS